MSASGRKEKRAVEIIARFAKKGKTKNHSFGRFNVSKAMREIIREIGKTYLKKFLVKKIELSGANNTEQLNERIFFES